MVFKLQTARFSSPIKFFELSRFSTKKVNRVLGTSGNAFFHILLSNKVVVFNLSFNIGQRLNNLASTWYCKVLTTILTGIKTSKKVTAVLVTGPGPTLI